MLLVPDRSPLVAFVEPKRSVGSLEWEPAPGAATVGADPVPSGPRRWSVVRWLVASAILAGLLVAGPAGLLMVHLHQRATVDTYRQLSGIALVVSRTIEANLQSIERLQDGFVEMVRSLDAPMQEDFDRLLSTRRVYQDLVTASRSLPFVATSFLLNADGVMIASTWGFPAPVWSYADRGPFKAMRDDPGLDHVLEAPVVSGFTGTWITVLWRRLTTTDGRFLGVVGVGLDIDHLNATLDRYDLGTGSSITIWRRDLRMVARSPAWPSRVGQPAVAGFSLPLEDAFATRDCCAIRRASMVDGVDRLLAIRALDTHAMAVVVTRGAEETFKAWRDQAWQVGAGVLMVWMMLAAAVFLALRHVGGRLRQEAAAADLRVQDAQRLGEDAMALMANRDALTGLGNRLLLQERLAATVQERQFGSVYALLCIDIDHFKALNDLLGRRAGDTLLRSVADRLSALAEPGDTLVRLGSDEFAVLHVGLTHARDAEAAAQRVLTALSVPFQVDTGGLDDGPVCLAISIGIAVSAHDGADAETMPRNADLALGCAKADGRNRYRLFLPEMTTRDTLRRRLQYDLVRALDAGEFALFYQPQVDLGTGLVKGFEALLRWHDPNFGLITPDTFIPMAEETGMIVPLGAWVIEQACMTAQTWPGEERVAVNLSPVQFDHPLLVETVGAALARSGLAPWRLELEVTEMVLLRDPEATLVTLHRLKALGLTVALDDFGTGYSSLSYLHRFPFDKVKIDRSFIHNIGRNTVSFAIVRAVTELCAVLGIKTNAEGVETEVQRELVIVLGCTESQGYLFGKARPANEAADTIERLRRNSNQIPTLHS